MSAADRAESRSTDQPTKELPVNASSTPGTTPEHPTEPLGTEPLGTEPLGAEPHGTARTERGPEPRTPPQGGASATGDVPAERPVSTEARVSTIVWGLVVTAVGALLLAVAVGASPDPQLVAIGVLAGAGMALLIGSVVASARRRGRR